MFLLLNGILGKLRNYLGKDNQVRGAKLTLYRKLVEQRYTSVHYKDFYHLKQLQIIMNLMNLTMRDIMLMMIEEQINHTYIAAEDQLERLRKNDNAY